MNPVYHVKLLMSCGAVVDVVQQEHGMNLELTVIPREGLPISDTAEIKDNKLIMRMTIESALDIQQLLDAMTGRNRKRKKILGLF